MAFKIDLKSPTVDFEFGNVKIQANVKDESFNEMLNIKESEEFKQAQKEAEELMNIDIDNLTKDQFKHAMDSVLQTFDTIYSPIFGEGSFIQVYNLTGSILITIDAFDEAMEHLNKIYIQDKTRTSQKYRNRKNRKKK